jgi:hypothetical protein
MKYLLTTIILVFSTSLFASDTDFTKSEHNWNFKGKKVGVNVRTYFQDDYEHVELKYKLNKKFEVALRLAEEGDLRENRYKLTHKIGKFGGIGLAHRIEYRAYDGTKTDYYRYRLIFSKKVKMSNNVQLWGKVQPRWKYYNTDGKTNDSKVDDVKTQVGFDYKINKYTSVGPYIEYLTLGSEDDFTKKSTMLGTKFTVKF